MHVVLWVDGKSEFVAFKSSSGVCMNVKVDFLEESEYVNENTSKQTIVIHHTAGPSLRSAVNWWKKDPRRVATHYIIERNGEVVQLIPESCWAYQGLAPRGANREHIKRLEAQAIGIELVAWGKLNEFCQSWTGATVPRDRIAILIPNWRGEQWFERYTDEQIHALGLLIKDIAKRNHIMLLTDSTAREFLRKGKKEDKFTREFVRQYFFSVNKRACEGAMGLWGHCSYTDTKTDPFPQYELISLLIDLFQEELIGV